MVGAVLEADWRMLCEGVAVGASDEMVIVVVVTLYLIH